MGMLKDLWEDIKGDAKWDAIKYGVSLMTLSLIHISEPTRH